MAGIDVLNEKHALSILLYVYRHDGCMKTELYSGIEGRSRLPEKIQGLDDAGLLRQDVSKATRIYITDDGKQVASKLAEIEGILQKIGKGNGPCGTARTRPDACGEEVP